MNIIYEFLSYLSNIGLGEKNVRLNEVLLRDKMIMANEELWPFKEYFLVLSYRVLIGIYKSAIVLIGDELIWLLLCVGSCEDATILISKETIRWCVVCHWELRGRIMVYK